MSDAEALAMIQAALDHVKTGVSASVSLETHLVDDGLLDSLDVMAFLYELERMNGGRISEIDETFDDFRVVRLIKLLTV